MQAVFNRVTKKELGCAREGTAQLTVSLFRRRGDAPSLVASTENAEQIEEEVDEVEIE